MTGLSGRDWGVGGAGRSEWWRVPLRGEWVFVAGVIVANSPLLAGGEFSGGAVMDAVLLWLAMALSGIVAGVTERVAEEADLVSGVPEGAGVTDAVVEPDAAVEPVAGIVE